MAPKDSERLRQLRQQLGVRATHQRQDPPATPRSSSSVPSGETLVVDDDLFSLESTNDEPLAARQTALEVAANPPAPTDAPEKRDSTRVGVGQAAPQAPRRPTQSHHALPPPPPTETEEADAEPGEERTIQLSADDIEPLTLRSSEVVLLPPAPPQTPPALAENSLPALGDPVPQAQQRTGTLRWGSAVLGETAPPAGPVPAASGPKPATTKAPPATPLQSTAPWPPQATEATTGPLAPSERAPAPLGAEAELFAASSGDRDPEEQGPEPIEPEVFEPFWDDAGDEAFEDGALYLHEAEALEQQQPERAATMYLAAAELALRSTDEGAAIECFQQAVDLGAESTRLMPTLRRWAYRLGQTETALRLTAKLVAAGGNGPQRVACCLEAAALARFQLGAADKALSLIQQALSIHPSHVHALHQSVALQLEAKQIQPAVNALETLTECLNAPEERTLCLYAAATLLDCKLGQREKAAEAYGRALDADPSNLPALLGCCELLERLGNWAELARRLEQLAGLDHEQAAAHLARAGALYFDRVGDLESAERTLRASASKAPTELAPRTRLAYVLEARGKRSELIVTLREILSLTVDREGQVALLTHIGELCLELDDHPQATQALTEAIGIDADHLPALQALGTLHRQHGDHLALLSLIYPESERSTNEGTRALRYLEAGDILAKQLNRPDEAMHAYQRALELKPGWPVCFWRLRSLYQQHGRHETCAELLAKQLQTLRDAPTRHQLLLELGRLRATALADIEGAADALKQARAIPQSRGPAIELIDLYARSGQHALLVEVLLTEAAATDDPAEAEYLLLRAADVLEEELDEHEKSLALYRQVQKEHSDSLIALRGAGRLLHRLGRFADLIDLYRQELAAAEAAEEVRILCRIGMLYSHKLQASDSAIETFLDVLTRAPGNPVALAYLERLCRREGYHAQLVDVLGRDAMSRKDPFAAADALCRAAELADAKLATPERAAELYQQALGHNPRCGEALAGQLSLELRRQQYIKAQKSLTALIEQTKRPMSAAHLQLSLARLLELRLGQAPSIERYQQAASSPYGSYLRWEQLRIRRYGSASEVASALVTLGAQTRDPQLAAAYYLEAAQYYEASGDHQQRLAAAERAFAQDTQEPAVLWQLQRAAAAAEAFSQQAKLLEREAAQQSEAVHRVPLLSEAMSAYDRAQAEFEAARVAEQAEQAEPGRLLSIFRLARFASSQQRWAELASCYDRANAALNAPENRVGLALCASDLWALRVGDFPRALASLKPALEHDPGHPDAFARAERLLRRGGDFVQLSHLYSRRITVCEDTTQRVELLRLNARLLDQRLNDAARAIAEYSLLLAIAPNDLEALAEQARLLSEQRRWPDAVAVLDTLISSADDQAVVHDARLHQAQLWLDALHEPGRARQVIEAALEQRADDVESQQLLIRVGFAEGSWKEVRQRLQGLSKHSNPSVRIWSFSKLAEAARGGLRDPELCRTSELAALKIAANSAALLDDLISYHLRAGRAERLAELASSAAATTTDADTILPLRLAAARVLLDELRRPAAALEHLRTVQLIDANHSDTSLLISRALEEQGAREEAVTGYRKLIANGQHSVEAARGLARLLGPLGQPAAAAACTALLALQGAASAAELRAAQEQSPPGAPAGGLRIDDLPLPADLSGMRNVLTHLHPHFGALHKLKLDAALSASHPVAVAAQRLADALGAGSIKVSIDDADWPGAVAQPAIWRPLAIAGVGLPALLRVSSELANEPLSPRFRFWIGRALATATGGGALLERLADEQLNDIFAALADSKPVSPALAQLRKQVLKVVPRRFRKLLEQIQIPTPHASAWAIYRERERERADQIGLLFAAQPHLAFSELLSQLANELWSPRMHALVLFGISEHYGTLYRALWSARG